MPEIQLATVLPGARPFRDNNVNDTFIGQVLLSDSATVRGAILKDLDSKQLANELLANVLARDLGLPTPDAYLAVVRGSDLHVTKAPHLKDGNRIVFASVDVRVPSVRFYANGPCALLVQFLRDLCDWDGLGHLYAFDTWIANIDRNPGNLLLGGKNEVWLIDHGHSFTGPSWQPSDLDPNAKYQNLLSVWLTSCLTNQQKQKRSSEVDSFSTKITSLDLGELRRRSRIDALLPPDHAAAVEKFLRDRIANVRSHAMDALGMLA
jgi:hypothetical protein